MQGGGGNIFQGQVECAGEEESGTLTEVTLKADVATKYFGQLAADGETKTGTAIFPGGEGGRLGETVEDDLLFLFGDTYSIVRDRKEKLCLRVFFDKNLHGAIPGEFQTVASEINKDLPEACGVAAKAGRDIGVDINGEADILLNRPYRKDGYYRIQK